MEIDKNKLAQMREESQDTLNVLEDVLSTNAEDETTIDVEVEETTTTTVPILPRTSMSLSPIKEKIGKLHIAFLKEIHELGKQSNMSNESIGAITKRYHVNLFAALSCIDEVAKEKYQFSILKESLYDHSSQQIRIEFDSENVEKFLSLESEDNWRTDLGCNRPDNSEFQQQIVSYLKEKGFIFTPKKVQKATKSNAKNKTSQIEFVLSPEAEQECGIKIEGCSAEQTGDYVKVIAKVTAKKSVPEPREVHAIAYDSNNKIIGRIEKWWEHFGRIQSFDRVCSVSGKVVKIEIFPVLP